MRQCPNLYYGFIKKHQGYTIPIVHAVITPVSKLMIPLGYFFYLYSLKKFKWGTMKVAVRKWKQLFACHCKTESKSSEQQNGPGPGGGENNLTGNLSEVHMLSLAAVTLTLPFHIRVDSLISVPQLLY